MMFFGVVPDHGHSSVCYGCGCHSLWRSSLTGTRVLRTLSLSLVNTNPVDICLTLSSTLTEPSQTSKVYCDGIRQIIERDRTVLSVAAGVPCLLHETGGKILLPPPPLVNFLTHQDICS